MQAQRLASKALPAITAAVVLGLGPARAAAAGVEYSGWWLPPNLAADYGGRLDLVFAVIGWITLVGAVGVLGVLAYALLRYRYRPGRRAAYVPGNRRVELWMVVLVTVFVIGGEVFVMGRVSGGVWDALKRDVPLDAMQVEVLAEQFGWNVRYPGADGVFGRTDPDLVDYDNPFGLDEDDAAAEDDVVTLGELHVPLRRPVVVHLRAKDVIHSFYIPVLRIKQDALPGERITVWFQAEQAGTFQLACAELCGLGHTTMKAAVVVESAEDLEAWLEELANW